MPSAFDSLQRASFLGIEFPISGCEVAGGIRDHIHEYPHAAGGSPEKMGRKLYIIRMQGNFQDRFPAYPKLWPQGLRQLRESFDKQLSGDLAIPTIGKMKCYARSWVQTMNPKASRSGETTTFEFCEDADSHIEFTEVNGSTLSLSKKLSAMEAAKLQTEFASTKDISVFDAVSNAINSVLAIGDLSNAALNLVTAKLLAVTDLCGQASNTLTAKNMKNAYIISALHDAWDTARQSNANLFKSQSRPLKYTVPFTMPMSSISTTLYGDATHTVELMQLNAVEDAFAVRAGTNIVYVQSSTTLTGGSVDVSRNGNAGLAIAK